MTDYEKPRTVFRNRKKHLSKEQQRLAALERNDLHHPQHRPYERDDSWRRNIVVDGRGDYEDDASE